MVAMQHGSDQLFALQEAVKNNSSHVQPQHGPEQPLAPALVPAGGPVDSVTRDKAHQRAGKRNLIVTDQACAHLHAQNQQHGDDRQRTQGVVAHMISCGAPALEITHQPCRAGDEGEKARPVPTQYPPHHAKQQQGQHHVAQPQMPFHGIAADFGRHYQGNGAGRQQPVKQAGGQIPDAQ